jgi:hypothetical protein
MLEIGGPAMPESRLIADFSGWFFSLLSLSPLLVDDGRGTGRPDTVGGGSSRPSLDRFDSCRAKSELYHHSKNLSAKIEVGSRIFKLPKSCGMIVSVIIRRLKMEFVWPGLAPGRAGAGFG